MFTVITLIALLVAVGIILVLGAFLFVNASQWVRCESMKKHQYGLREHSTKDELIKYYANRAKVVLRYTDYTIESSILDNPYSVNSIINLFKSPEPYNYIRSRDLLILNEGGAVAFTRISTKKVYVILSTNMLLPAVNKGESFIFVECNLDNPQKIIRKIRYDLSDGKWYVLPISNHGVVIHFLEFFISNIRKISYSRSRE